MGQSPASDDYIIDGNGLPFLQGNAEFGVKYPNPRVSCDVARKVVHGGDLLISVRAPVGALNIADQSYGIGRGLCAITVNNTLLDQSFSWYLLHHIRGQLHFQATGSTYDAVAAEDVGNMIFVLPNLSEQRVIAIFLDREAARIDALIEKKQRQIELLQEKRTALISHAVTKGIDPNVKMKDSGIEWLGKIPEHWEILRFKFVLWLQRGHDLPTTEFVEGQYPVCGSNGCIGYHNNFTTKGPGVTVGRSGSVGEVNYVVNDFWAHNTALYVKEFRRSIPRYAFYLLKTLDVEYLSEGTAVGTLNRNYIHNLPIAIPVVEEQHAIAAFIDRETERIDSLIEKIRQSIDSLREYRTALISAVVTGKIDVREEVAA
jgi:type I restriction enzyme S subunit